MSDITKIVTPEVLPPSIAEAWFGPGYTIPQIAPQNTQPRVWDYPFNTNQVYPPRKYSSIGYEQLRMLAQNCYPLRIIMERFKSRIAAHDWELRLKAKPGEAKSSLSNRSWNDPRIKALTAFFQQPDGEHDWPEWIKGCLEDNIVIDAMAIWADRDSRDKIARLVQVDGATINRAVDAQGMTPRPPLIAYQQIIKGMPAIDLRADELLFVVENYRPDKLFGFSTVEQTMLLIQTQLNRALWTLNHYTEGNIPEVFLLMDGTKYTPDQIKDFMQNFESRMDGRLDNRQRVYPLPDGKVQELRGAELFEGFDEFMMRIFSYQIGEPVTPLVKGNNRAEAKQIDDTREEVGEIPKLKFVSSKINRLIQSPLFFGHSDIEFAWRESETLNPLEQAQIDFIQVPLGITTVDEARARDGKEPLTEEQQQQIASMKSPPKPPPNENDEEDGPEVAAKISKSQKKTLHYSPLTQASGMSSARSFRY